MPCPAGVESDIIELPSEEITAIRHSLFKALLASNPIIEFLDRRGASKFLITHSYLRTSLQTNRYEVWTILAIRSEALSISTYTRTITINDFLPCSSPKLLCTLSLFKFPTPKLMPPSVVRMKWQSFQKIFIFSTYMASAFLILARPLIRSII